MQLIGFEDKPQEIAFDKLSRLHMIDFVCRMTSNECLDQMHSKLVSYIDDDKEKLPVDMESSVFSFGLMASALKGESTRFLESLWKKMQASNDIEYRLRVIESLGYFGDVKALFDLLETILASTSEVRYLAAENFKIIQSVYSHSVEGVEATMNFMIEYRNDAVRRSQTSNLIEILIKNLSKRIYNERLREKVSQTEFNFKIKDLCSSICFFTKIKL